MCDIKKVLFFVLAFAIRVALVYIAELVDKSD